MVGEAKPMQSLRGPGGNLRDLTLPRVVARVVELKSFSEVARRSGITPATVSKHVASLEGALLERNVHY